MAKKNNYSKLNSDLKNAQSNLERFMKRAEEYAEIDPSVKQIIQSFENLTESYISTAVDFSNAQEEMSSFVTGTQKVEGNK